MEKEQLQELIENNKEDIFSEIKDEISDDTVTDIEWDGYNLWITQLGRGCYISMKELSDKYMDNLSIRLNKVTMPKSKLSWNLSYSHALSSTP